MVHTLPQALSLYIFFYHTYCKMTKDGQEPTTTNPGATLLFSGPQNKRSRDLLKHVRQYARRIRLPSRAMGLDGRNYYLVSQRQWMACRAAGHTEMDLGRVASDATRIGLSLHREDKHYRGLSAMRPRVPPFARWTWESWWEAGVTGCETVGC